MKFKDLFKKKPVEQWQPKGICHCCKHEFNKDDLKPYCDKTIQFHESLKFCYKCKLWTSLITGLMAPGSEAWKPIEQKECCKAVDSWVKAIKIDGLKIIKVDHVSRGLFAIETQSFARILIDKQLVLSTEGCSDCDQKLKQAAKDAIAANEKAAAEAEQQKRNSWIDRQMSKPETFMGLDIGLDDYTAVTGYHFGDRGKIFIDSIKAEKINKPKPKKPAKRKVKRG